MAFVFHYSPSEGDKAKKWFVEQGAVEMSATLCLEDWSIRTKYE